MGDILHNLIVIPESPGVIEDIDFAVRMVQDLGLDFIDRIRGFMGMFAKLFQFFLHAAEPHAAYGKEVPEAGGVLCGIGAGGEHGESLIKPCACVGEGGGGMGESVAEVFHGGCKFSAEFIEFVNDGDGIGSFDVECVHRCTHAVDGGVIVRAADIGVDRRGFGKFCSVVNIKA